MTVGDIYWVELPPTNGHEQAGRRPAVVLQDEIYGGQLPLVLVVPLTGAIAATRFAGTVKIAPTQQNGLRQESVALVFQLRAIDRQRLRDRVGSLSPEDLVAVFNMLDNLMGRKSSA